MVLLLKRLRNSVHFFQVSAIDLFPLPAFPDRRYESLKQRFALLKKQQKNATKNNKNTTSKKHQSALKRTRKEEDGEGSDVTDQSSEHLDGVEDQELPAQVEDIGLLRDFYKGGYFLNTFLATPEKQNAPQRPKLCS